MMWDLNCDLHSGGGKVSSAGIKTPAHKEDFRLE